MIIVKDIQDATTMKKVISSPSDLAVLASPASDVIV